MARKSLELRLGQTKALIDEYVKAGLVSDRSCHFMNDMMHRMERGKGMSTGQRKYLDNLIDQGVPTLKNETRVKEILAAADVDGMQQVAQTLKDFAYKLGKGWSLSEKQEKFLTNLLAKAATLKLEGRFRPCEETVEDLENAAAICATKNSWYWNHRPGTAKSYDKVREWLEWNTRREVIEDVEALGKDSIHILGEEPIIDQWACDKLLKACKKPLEELKNPKHQAGEIRHFRGGPQIALIVGTPILQKGEVVYPVIVDGEQLMTHQLNKRRSRKM